jgi:hypothetical protein
LPHPSGVPLRTAPICVLDFVGLLADLPHMPVEDVASTYTHALNCMSVTVVAIVN